MGIILGLIGLAGRAISDASKNKKAEEYLKNLPYHIETVEEFKARSEERKRLGLH